MNIRLDLKLRFASRLLAALLALPLSAAAQTSERAFTLGSLNHPEAVLPYKQYSGDSTTLRNLLFPPILTVGNDGRVRCILCKEIPTVESRKGESGTFVISLELKKDLRWGDGTTLNALDVKYTLESMAKANYPSGRHPILPIRRIELDKEQSRKLTLILSHRRSDAFQLFAISLLPAHKAKELEVLATNPRQAVALIKDPAYTYGPYRVASTSVAASVTPPTTALASSPSQQPVPSPASTIKPAPLPEKEQTWQLVSNEKTDWDQKPEQPLVVKFFANRENLAAALKSSGIDQSDELSWEDYRELRKSWIDLSSKYEVSSIPSDRMQVLVLNLHSPLLVNPQLRQALHHAMNRDSLNKIQFEGLGTPSSGLLSDGFATRLDLKREPAHNVKLATQILDQSGWIRGGDGLRASEGQHFVLSLTCPADRLNEQWLESLKTDLSALGIKLEVEHPEAQDFMKKIVSERRFKDLACVGWNLPPLSIPNNIFHSLAIPNRENNYFGANYSAWDQHVVDKLLDNMLRETDLHHFAKQFARLEKQFLSDLPAIPLIYEPKVTLSLKTPFIRPSEELSRVLQTPEARKL